MFSTRDSGSPCGNDSDGSDACWENVTIELAKLNLKPCSRLRPVIIDGEGFCDLFSFGENVSRYILMALRLFILKGHQTILLMARSRIRRLCNEDAMCEQHLRFLKKANLLAIFRDEGEECDRLQFVIEMIKEAYATGSLIITNNELRPIFGYDDAHLSTLKDRVVNFCLIKDRLSITLDSSRKRNGRLVNAQYCSFASDDLVAKTTNSLDANSQRLLLYAIDMKLMKTNL